MSRELIASSFKDMIPCEILFEDQSNIFFVYKDNFYRFSFSEIALTVVFSKFSHPIFYSHFPNEVTVENIDSIMKTLSLTLESSEKNHCKFQGDIFKHLINKEGARLWGYNSSLRVFYTIEIPEANTYLRIDFGVDGYSLLMTIRRNLTYNRFEKKLHNDISLVNFIDIYDELIREYTR